jgi:lipooligosaccharide transport system permease protein
MATLGPTRSFEYWSLVYRRTWRASVVGSVIGPTLYLTAMGLGLGSIVDDRADRVDLGGVKYLVFLAPGLLAANALTTAAVEGTWPVMSSIKWSRTYHAMLATPLRVADVFVGHLGYIVARVLFTSTLFTAVMAAFGAVDGWRVVLAIPAAGLLGAAIAAPIAAFAATRETDNSFAGLNRFVIVPMFLFSGTFFPISQLPMGLRVAAACTPLWHGVDLCRTLALGTATPARTLAHVAYLGGLAVLGSAVGLRTFRRRLTP